MLVATLQSQSWNQHHYMNTTRQFTQSRSFLAKHAACPILYCRGRTHKCTGGTAVRGFKRMRKYIDFMDLSRISRSFITEYEFCVLQDLEFSESRTRKFGRVLPLTDLRQAASLTNLLSQVTFDRLCGNIYESFLVWPYAARSGCFLIF